ncbi:calcium-transporting ATPase 2, plasma membrane-type-like protein [Tanacetum coccineum]
MQAYISYFNWLPEKLRVAVLVSKAAFHFLKSAWVQPETDDCTVPDEVKAAGFDICADKTSTSDGLSNEGLRRRQELFGINNFTETAQKSFWVFVWDALHDMTLMVLGSCAFVSLIVGIAIEGWPKCAHDGLGIAASILCKKCSKIYSAESSSGTGNLKRHLEKCLNSTTRDIGQYMIYNKGVLDTRNAKFSQEKFRELLVHAVARHDLPFSFTKYEGVRDVFKYLEPDVTHITRNTTKADMLKLHGVESWPKGAHDGLGIASSILVVVFVTATSDYRQSLQFKGLDKEKKKISIQVTRNEFRQKLSIYELLVGDIIHLVIGDQVPADGLFVSGFTLSNSTCLTGQHNQSGKTPLLQILRHFKINVSDFPNLDVKHGVHSSFYDLHMTNTNTDVVYQELQKCFEGFPSGISVSCLPHLETVYIMEFNRSLDFKALGMSTLDDIVGMMGEEYVLWFEGGESREKYAMSTRMVEMRRKLYLKREVQELLIRYGGEIEFNSFEDSYKDHFNEKLAYDYYGLTRGLEELCEILEDILVVEEANPSRKAYISYFNWLPEKLRVAVLVSKAAFHFLKSAWVQLETDDCIVPDEVKAASFDICADEVGLRRRQELFGINNFAETAQKSFWVFIWDALHDMTLMVLRSCAFVSLIVGIVTEGWPKGAHDGLGIAASILLVVSVTATSDYRQSLQFKDLDKEKKKISIQVTRNAFR